MPQKNQGEFMKKLVPRLIGVAFITLATTLSFAPMSQAAAGKVNCDAVMKELNAGKKPRQVAQDLSISVSSVYRCRRRARAHAGKPTASPAASPAAASH
jgi:hypothetical protein